MKKIIALLLVLLLPLSASAETIAQQIGAPEYVTDTFVSNTGKTIITVEADVEMQHATYTMHNFGYDLLPRVHTSYLILGGTSVALMIVSAIAMRRFSFNFTGGYSDE